MRRLTMIVVLTAGCASNAPPPAPNPATRDLVTAGEGMGTVHVEAPNAAMTETRVTTLSASPSAVWAILPLAFQDLGIALSTVDSTQLVMGNTGQRVRRELGDTRLSRYLNCGTSGMGLSIADRYDVRLTVFSSVRAAPTGSSLLTQVSAAASQPGVAGGAVQCASTGALEDALGRAVQLRLSGLGNR